MAKDQNVLICMHPIFVFFILFKYIPIAGVRTYRSMHPVVYLLEKQHLSIHGGGLFFGCRASRISLRVNMLSERIASRIYFVVPPSDMPC